MAFSEKSGKSQLCKCIKFKGLLITCCRSEHRLGQYCTKLQILLTKMRTGGECLKHQAKPSEFKNSKVLRQNETSVVFTDHDQKVYDYDFLTRLRENGLVHKLTYMQIQCFLISCTSNNRSLLRFCD